MTVKLLSTLLEELVVFCQTKNWFILFITLVIFLSGIESLPVQLSGIFISPLM